MNIEGPIFKQTNYAIIIMIEKIIRNRMKTKQANATLKLAARLARRAGKFV